MKTDLALAVALCLVACSPAKAPPPSPPLSFAPAAEAPPFASGGPAADAWLGRWNGPEGLFLDIATAQRGGGAYVLTNKHTLDDQGVFEGRAAGAGVTFIRDGQALTIRKGNGAETGFKYLADKTDCLIVVPGQEGYCR